MSITHFDRRPSPAPATALPMAVRPGRFDTQTVLLVAMVALLTVMGVLFFVAEQRRETDTRLEIAGGGFLYNYRIAEIRYNIAIRLVRPMPIGTRLEVEFENPAGGPPITLSRTLGTDTNRVGFESPALTDVEADRPYSVVVRLRDRDTGDVLETHERTFRTTVDPAVMPDAPLTIGPGYQRNPASQ